MKSYRLLALALVALAALLLVAAAGCKTSKKDSGDDAAAGQTPVEEPADGGDGDGGGDGADSGDGGETPAPPPEDGGGDDVGSASIRLDEQVSGDFILTGMTCDHFPNNSDDPADDQYNASISGDVGGVGYTFDVTGVGLVSLSGGEPFGKWDNSLPGSSGVDPDPDYGRVTRTEAGGDLDVALAPAELDPGAANDEVRASGSWTCPGGTYTTFEG